MRYDEPAWEPVGVVLWFYEERGEAGFSNCSWQAPPSRIAVRGAVGVCGMGWVEVGTQHCPLPVHGQVFAVWP